MAPTQEVVDEVAANENALIQQAVTVHLQQRTVNLALRVRELEEEVRDLTARLADTETDEKKSDPTE